jgi:YidC/Oxa1 family membrane protein insertase
LTPVIAQGFLGIEHFNPPWDIFFLPLFNLLIFLSELPFVGFALAIVLFTIIIRTILAPLFVRQIRSQKEMQRMQPLVREVQRKHKGNRQKIYEETQALYREHGVNPAAGCLPVLLQLPILFALYQALIRASGIVTGFVPNEGNQAAFDALQATTPPLVVPASQANEYIVQISGPCNLPEFSQLPQFLPLNCQLINPIKLTEPVNTTVAWLGGLDLARVDHVFAITIFGGFALSGLAIIAAILQFVQVKMTAPPPNSEDPTSSMTSTMTYTFPLLTIFWGGIFPSGLILYWIVYTAFLVVQQYTIMGWGNLFPIAGWQPRWAPSSAEPAPPRLTKSTPAKGTPTKGAPAKPNNGPPNDGQPATNAPTSASASGGNRQRQRSGQRRRRGRRR